MIRPLRQRHRHMVIALGVTLPIAFAAGIAARRTVPQHATLPPALSSWTQRFTATDYERGDLFGNAPVRVRLWREQGTGRYAVAFSAAKDFLKPDLLAYWIEGHPKVADTLPPEARLLGAFIAGPLVLPTEAAITDGSLILFSLANQELVAVSKPIRVDDSMK